MIFSRSRSRPMLAGVGRPSASRFFVLPSGLVQRAARAAQRADDRALADWEDEGGAPAEKNKPPAKGLREMLDVAFRRRFGDAVNSTLAHGDSADPHPERQQNEQQTK
jgi:hypothetical protein